MISFVSGFHMSIGHFYISPFSTSNLDVFKINKGYSFKNNKYKKHQFLACLNPKVEKHVRNSYWV